MAATVEVRNFTGASPGLGVDVTNQTMRLKLADNSIQDDQNPVPVPASGVAFSFRKSLKIVATTAPDNRIRNLRFFTLGESLGPGRDVFFARTGSYVQATTADEGGAIGSTNVDLLTPTTPEVIQAGDVILSSDSFPTDGGARQDFVMLQLRNDPTATVGNAAAAKSLAYEYDES